jgi:hypothetical protein
VQVFYEGELSDFLNKRERDLGEEVRRQNEPYILNVNVDEYVEHLVDKYVLDIPELDRTDVFVEPGERMIPAEQFPFSSNVYRGKSYPRPVLTYHVPFSGDMQLLRYTPSTRIAWTMDMDVVGNALTFEIVVFTEDPAPVKQEGEQVLNRLEQQLGYLISDARNFNASLESNVRSLVEGRKADFLKRSSFVHALGVKVRKRDDLPDTFSVPPPERRKRISPKPVAKARSELEPTLDAAVYQEILQTIWDLGRTMERMPSTYADKDEETLRDHILLYLTPRFEGSSTGETFNKTGKTDILLRYDNSNVFIAECKFWSGSKALLGAIDQLLHYLTWRDSKASLVAFVANKDFSAVLDSIRETMPNHAQFVRHVADHGESWFEYRFSLPGDPGREVWLTLLAFHLPKPGKRD